MGVPEVDKHILVTTWGAKEGIKGLEPFSLYDLEKITGFHRSTVLRAIEDRLSKYVYEKREKSGNREKRVFWLNISKTYDDHILPIIENYAYSKKIYLTPKDHLLLKAIFDNSFVRAFIRKAILSLAPLKKSRESERIPEDPLMIGISTSLGVTFSVRQGIIFSYSFIDKKKLKINKKKTLPEVVRRITKISDLEFGSIKDIDQLKKKLIENYEKSLKSEDLKILRQGIKAIKSFYTESFKIEEISNIPEEDIILFFAYLQEIDYDKIRKVFEQILLGSSGIMPEILNIDNIFLFGKLAFEVGFDIGRYFRE